MRKIVIALAVGLMPLLGLVNAAYIYSDISRGEAIHSIHNTLDVVEVVVVPGTWNTYMARTVKNEVYVAYGKLLPFTPGPQAEVIPVLPGLRNGLMCFEEVQDGENIR
jgi:hypothetical protein